MYTDNTKRRSLINRLLPVSMVSLFYLFIASPFVLDIDSRWNNWFGGVKLAKAYSFGLSLKHAAEKAGFSEATNQPASLPVVIGLIIKSAIALIGVVFLILAIIAGLRWMWSGGDEETIKAAKQSIKNSIIGAIVSWGAYAITYYVMKALF